MLCKSLFLFNLTDAQCLTKDGVREQASPAALPFALALLGLLVTLPILHKLLLLLPLRLSPPRTLCL